MSIQWIVKVLEHSKTKGSVRLLMISLANHADEKGVAYPGKPRIATEIGEQLRNIYNIIDKAKEMGEISELAEPSPYGTTQYQLKIDESYIPVPPKKYQRRKKTDVQSLHDTKSPNGVQTLHACRAKSRTSRANFAEKVRDFAPEPSFYPSDQPSIKTSLSLSVANRADEENPAPTFGNESEWALPQHPQSEDTQTAHKASNLNSPPVAVAPSPPRRGRQPAVPLAVDSEPIRLAQQLRFGLHNFDPHMKLPGEAWDDADLQRWARDIEKMIRLDGRDADTIARVIAATVTDPFWQKNVHSGAKLREKYDQLRQKLLDKNLPMLSNNRQTGQAGVTNGQRKSSIGQAPRGADAYAHDRNDTIRFMD